MEKFIHDLKKRLAECTEWLEVSDVLKSGISPENIPHILEILKEFSITEPEIKDMIEKYLDKFLVQMKIVCFHVISTFFNTEIRKSGNTDFFTIHVKWFYVIFVYFSLKKMVNKKILVWTNFKENQNIQKMFIDALIKYEFELPLDFSGRGLRPDFRIIMLYITSSPLSILNGIGGVPDYMKHYPK
jgi:predicted nucleotidyltransferase